MKKLIVANWKMQLSYRASLSLAQNYAKKIKHSRHEVVICPDYLALPVVAQALRLNPLVLGAQDSAVAISGAYTGEVSPSGLKALGVKYVILGHSERREHLHENLALINAKIKVALDQKLIPILCVGEKMSEKESGETKKYLARELAQALKGVKIKNESDLVIAYEPVWAISSNKKAKPLAAPEADEIQAFIKIQVNKLLKKKVRVLYGGSVSAVNAAGFLAQENVAGLLVGSASLRLKDFSAIC